MYRVNKEVLKRLLILFALYTFWAFLWLEENDDNIEFSHLYDTKHERNIYASLVEGGLEGGDF